jgi:hypothetical protein
LAAETPYDAKIKGEDCALCEMFVENITGEMLMCKGCPVSERTGESNCYRTPWYMVRDALSEWKCDDCEETKNEYKKLAQAELDFLKSLLPS